MVSDISKHTRALYIGQHCEITKMDVPLVNTFMVINPLLLYWMGVCVLPYLAGSFRL